MMASYLVRSGQNVAKVRDANLVPALIRKFLAGNSAGETIDIAVVSGPSSTPRELTFSAAQPDLNEAISKSVRENLVLRPRSPLRVVVGPGHTEPKER